MQPYRTRTRFRHAEIPFQRIPIIQSLQHPFSSSSVSSSSSSSVTSHAESSAGDPPSDSDSLNHSQHVSMDSESPQPSKREITPDSADKSSPISSDVSASPSVPRSSTSPPTDSSSVSNSNKRLSRRSKSKTMIKVFIQQWTKKQVQQEFDKILDLLYPSFEPTDADESDLSHELESLRDAWQKYVSRETTSVVLPEIQSHGGRYQLDQVETDRPLVIPTLQMQEFTRFKFEADSETAETTSEKELSALTSEKEEVEANQTLVDMQRALRPLLSQFFNVHPVTIEGTPLREALHIALDALLTASYGYETRLFAICLAKFQQFPFADLPQITLERFVAAAVTFAFEYHTQFSADIQEQLSQFLLILFRTRSISLSAQVQLDIMELALNAELEDQCCNELIGKLMLPNSLKLVPQRFLLWCSCARSGPEFVPTPTPGSVNSTPQRRVSNSSADLGGEKVVAAACLICQRQREMESADGDANEVASLTLHRMIDAIMQSKRLQPSINKFMRAPMGVQLSKEVMQLSSQFFPASAAPSNSRNSLRSSGVAPHQLICHLILIATKWATCTDSVKRQLQGLRLLLVLLQRTAGLFLSSAAFVLVLRTVVMPSLLTSLFNCLATEADATSCFRYCLSIYTYLWENMCAFVPAEIGWSFHALLVLVESSSVTLKQKFQLLDLMRNLVRSPRHLMLLYYNYDYHLNQWKVVDRLFACLIHVLEGEFESLPSGPHDDLDVTAEEVSTAALKLIVHLLFMQAQWVGVPGLKRLGRVPKPFTDPEGDKKQLWEPVLTQHQREQQLDDQAFQLAKAGKLKAALRYLQQLKPCSGSFKEMARYLMETEGLNPADIGDFLANLDDDFLNKKQYDELRRAYLHQLDFTGLSFDAALRVYLCDSGFRLPGEAQKIDRMLEAFCVAYCRDNPGLFANSSTAFIVCFALVMLNTDLHDPRLRTGKSSRKPMTQDQFRSNLRGVDDGKDFPKEFLNNLYNNIQQQSIEWKEAPAPTENGTSKRNSLSRSERVKQQREHAAHAVSQVRRRVLTQMRRASLQNHSWAEPKGSWLGAPFFATTWYRILATISMVSEHHQQHDGWINLCCDALAYGSTIAIVLGMESEQSAFASVIAKLTYVENARIDYRKRCDDAQIKKHTKRSVHGDASDDDDEDEENEDVPLAKEFESGLSRKVSTRAHLKQSWFQQLSRDDVVAEISCKSIFSVCSQLKSQLNHERRLQRVQQLQQKFGNEVSLSTIGRELLKEGVLTQLKSTTLFPIKKGRSSEQNGDELSASQAAQVPRRNMVVLLFTDLLLLCAVDADSSTPRAYDSLSALPPFTWHRAYHLSLLGRPVEMKRFDDVDSGTYAFSLTSPQSKHTIVLSAVDVPSRQQWMAAIDAQIDLIEQRQAGCKSMRNLHVTLRSSRFIGSPLSLELSPDAELFLSDQFCRLCLRSYHSLLRRKAQCHYCATICCSECCQKRVVLNATLQDIARVKRQGTSVTSVDEQIDGSMLQESSNGTKSTAAAASRLFSKAKASVSKMQSTFTNAMSKLNDMSGIPICDACYPSVQQQLMRFASQKANEPEADDDSSNNHSHDEETEESGHENDED